MTAAEEQAQEILDKQGYIVMAGECPLPIGAKVPEAVGFLKVGDSMSYDVLEEGHLVVVGQSSSSEYMAQYRRFFKRAISTGASPSSESAGMFKAAAQR